MIERLPTEPFKLKFKKQKFEFHQTLPNLIPNLTLTPTLTLTLTLTLTQP
jgi:hypothetical protein